MQIAPTLMRGMHNLHDRRAGDWRIAMREPLCND